jgi:hypothetical protein
MKKRSVELTLNECESLLLLYRGREHQQLGFADSARVKITKARNEMIEEFERENPRDTKSLPKSGGGERRGEFNRWDRRKETLKKEKLPLFED